VRVEQREPGGCFHRAVWEPGKGWTYRTLKTADRAEARKLAEQFLREFEKVGTPPAPEPAPLTLAELCTRYQQEAPGYRNNTKRTQEQKRAAAERLKVVLGETERVDQLTLNDVDRYAAMRRSGVGWPDGRVRTAVRAAAVRDDLATLRAMILWACRERRPDGRWLLAENPLRGMKMPREENPRRPVATFDRFEKVRAAAQELAETAPQERGRERWLRFELALVLAEATGRRVGAIRGLRWSDIHEDPPEIRWRAEFDKRGREIVVPVPAVLAAELRRFQRRLKAVGDGWLFPKRGADAPWPRDLFGELLGRAEAKAGLPRLAGGKWHAYRRKWATERKTLSVVDVMAAGGWKDLKTLTTCYEQADAETMLAVMACPAKLRERRAAGAGR
jgi:integrase